MLSMSVAAKTTLTFSTLVIAALSLVFAVGPIVANQKAHAATVHLKMNQILERQYLIGPRIVI